MKNKQLGVLDSKGGYNCSHLCRMHKKAFAMVSALTMLFTTATVLPYSNFNLVGELTASAEEENECIVHKLEFMEEKKATCTQDGNIRFWYCTNCYNFFRDENGTDKIEEGDEDKVFIPATGHNLSGEYAFDRQNHWKICLNNCNDPHKEYDDDVKKYGHTVVDGKCSVCGLDIDSQFVVDSNMDFSKEESTGNWKENATLKDDGYQWDAASQTLTLGNIYINGNLILPYNDKVDKPATIVIDDGANPIVSKNIEYYPNATSLTVKGKGTLAAGFNNWNTGLDNMLTITGGAEVITSYIEWCAAGGISISDGGKLNVSEYFQAEKIAMDDTAEIDINTAIYSYFDVEKNRFADYIPEGYKIETIRDGSVYYTFFIPQDAVAVFNENTSLYEVQDKEGNLVTGKVTLRYNPYEDGIGEHLTGHSVSLDGNIGVNFYMELDRSVIEDSGAYMQFTLPDGKTTSKVKVGEAKTAEVDGKKYHVFSCNVAPKEITDIITAQIITSDGRKGKVYEYSVLKYIDYILTAINSDGEYTYDEKTRNLVGSMMSYCGMAREYFEPVDEEPVDEEIEVTSDDLINFEKQINGTLPKGIEYYGSSLLLESETTVRHYFKAAKGTDVSKYGFKEKNGYYYADISNIPAGQLGEAQETKIDNWSISYSPMSYVYSVLNSDSADKNLVNLCKALYLYHQAAAEYQSK